MSACRSSTSSLRFPNISPVTGCITSSAKTLPKIRSAIEDTTSPSFTAARAVIDFSVPQSHSRTIQS